MKFILFAFVSIFMNSLYAGYENTNWGMTLDEVKKLYPNGETINNQNGTVNYRLIKDIAGHSSSILGFEFGDNNKLRQVNIAFSEVGEPIDLKNGAVVTMKKKECNALYEQLRKSLSEKYKWLNDKNLPQNAEVKQMQKMIKKFDGDLFLNLIDDNNIDIIVLAKDGTKDRCAPFIGYSKHDENARNQEKMKGL